MADQHRDAPPQPAQPKTPPANTADASVRFYMSKNGMRVGISSYQPAREGGRPLSVEILAECLRRSGVSVPLQGDEAAEAVRMLLAGEPFDEVQRIAVARGVPPEEPRHAAIVLEGDPALPVVPGTRIGRLIPPRPGRIGRTVDGRPLPPSDLSPPKPVALGKGVALEPDGTLTAKALGLVRASEQSLDLEPLLRVSDDRLSVWATLPARDFAGLPILPEALEEGLRAAGITAPLRLVAVRAALRRLAEGRPPAPLALAVGKPPVSGRDARLELLVKGREKIGAVRPDGRIDFRERGAFPSVLAGTPVALLVPPQPGTPGVDIFGHTLPAKGGRPLAIRTGDNVAASEDGLRYTATAPGMLVLRNGVLEVSELLEIEGDVDISTGNVRLERGSLRVPGNVTSGFIVTAPGDVVVSGAVESAQVRAGNNLTVAGGLLIGAKVSAGGSVMARFADHADIDAGGDVILADNLGNSTVKAKGRILCAKGKGVVFGGEILCGRGLVAQEIGGELGIATNIHVRVDPGRVPALRGQRKLVKARLRHIAKTLGDCDPATLLQKTPRHRQKILARVISHRLDLEQRLRELAQELAREEEALFQRLEEATVVARRAIHPPTTIRIADQTLHVTETLHACTIAWDRTTRRILAKCK